MEINGIWGKTLDSPQHCQDFYSGPEAITGAGLTLLIQTTKKLEKISPTTVFQILDIRQEKTVIPEKLEVGKANPTLAPLTILREFSGMAQGGET